MIVQKDGEQFTVDTTNKEIDVILYFPKLSADKGLESIGTGSMRDKGKELIDQAREVQFRKLETFKNKVKDGYNSTRHKSQGGEAHIDEWPYSIKAEDFWIRSKKAFNKEALGLFINSFTGSEEPIENLVHSLRDEGFREDKLSQANQEKQKSLNKGLAKAIDPQVKQFDDSDDEFVKYGVEIRYGKEIAEKFKEAYSKVDCQPPKSIEELISNFSSAGKKDNKEKPQLSLLFKQFPLALEAIAKCSEYGHEKYKDTDSDYLNFKRVDGGSKTYADAGLRHRLEQGLDKESGLPHAWHTAWNALAELQLILENK